MGFIKCKHIEGCEKKAQTGGLCMAHGGTVTKCKHIDGASRCKNYAKRAGLCKAHGGPIKYTCKHPAGCLKWAQIGRFCIEHGGRTYKQRKDVDSNAKKGEAIEKGEPDHDYSSDITDDDIYTEENGRIRLLRT